jgi:hypothetical protein
VHQIDRVKSSLVEEGLAVALSTSVNNLTKQIPQNPSLRKRNTCREFSSTNKHPNHYLFVIMEFDFGDFDFLSALAAPAEEIKLLRSSWKWQEAVDKINSLSSFHKKDPEIMDLHARSLQALGRFSEALNIWNEFPTQADTKVLCEKIECLASLNRTKEAFEIASECVKNHPEKNTFSSIWLRLMINIKGPQNVLQELLKIKNNKQLTEKNFDALLEAVRAKLVSLFDPNELLKLEFHELLCLEEQRINDKYDFKHIYNQFIPLGNNCEFGFVQRQRGVEPLSLFRWTSINPQNLITLLGNKLSDYDAPDHYSLAGNQDVEYILKESKYATASHTGVKRSDIAPDEFLKKLVNRQIFLKRKLLDELADGNKVFLYKSNDSMSQTMMTDIMEKLTGLGAKRCIFVVRSDDKHPAGSINVMSDQIIIGHLSDNMPNIKYSEWDQIISAAYDCFYPNAISKINSGKQ